MTPVASPVVLEKAERLIADGRVHTVTLDTEAGCWVGVVDGDTGRYLCTFIERPPAGLHLPVPVSSCQCERAKYGACSHVTAGALLLDRRPWKPKAAAA